MDLKQLKALRETQEQVRELVNNTIESHTENLEEQRKKAREEIRDYFYELADVIGYEMRITVEHQFDFYTDIVIYFNNERRNKEKVTFGMRYHSNSCEVSYTWDKICEHYDKDINVLIEDWQVIKTEIESQVEKNIRNKMRDDYDRLETFNNHVEKTNAFEV